ncbi:MAG: hypothetical protein NZ908_01810 [Candidatus Micrarchaeota archaeon]|nr:hypothetical protein [Candidatus Micrarchaeota archaeon]
MSGTDMLNTTLRNVMNNLVDTIVPLLIFLIGATVVWLLAKLISRTIISVIWNKAGLEKILEQYKLKDALLGIEIKSVANVLLFLYLFLIGLVLVMDISIKQIAGSLQIQQVLVGIMGYMSSLIQGVVILMVFLLLADLISDKIREKEHLMFKDYLAMVVQAFIAILGFVVSMPAIFPSSNVELVGNVVLVMFAGIAFGFALAFGLAFGLGAQDIVAKRLEKFIKENLENK